MAESSGWTKVVYKKKSKDKKKQKKIIKLKTQLWYDETTWQHKVLINKLKFKDGKRLVQHYELEELCQKFSNCETNYKKNGIFKKLLKVISKDEWNKIKENVIEF